MSQSRIIQRELFCNLEKRVLSSFSYGDIVPVQNAYETLAGQKSVISVLILDQFRIGVVVTAYDDFFAQVLLLVVFSPLFVCGCC